MSATEMKVIAEARRRNAAMSLSQAREWVRGLSADALALYAAGTFPDRVTAAAG